MRLIFNILIGSAILVASYTAIAEPTALAAAKGCMACHDINVSKLGPAFKDIATRYSQEQSDLLVKHVLEGGSGQWGNIPMPANSKLGVTQSEAEQLVDWILTLK